MTTPKHRQIHLIEALILMISFGGFQGILIYVFRTNTAGAFVTATIATGLAGLLFIGIVRRFRDRGLPRSLLLLACLALVYGVSALFSPHRSIPGESLVFESFRPRTFVEEYAAKNGIAASVWSSGGGGSSSGQKRLREFELEIEVSVDDSNAALQAFHDYLSDKIGEQGAWNTGRGQGLRGAHKSFTLGYRQQGLEGMITVSTLRASSDGEERQIWYGFILENAR